MPDAIAPPPPTSKLKIFFRRLTSTVVLWTAILTAMFSSNKLVSDYFFLAAMTFLAAAGLIEYGGNLGDFHHALRFDVRAVAVELHAENPVLHVPPAA
jgi:hypothetical protein